MGNPLAKGNPNWVKGGPSPNPKGRPRDAVAALIDRIAGPNAERQIKLIVDAADGLMPDPAQPGAFVRVPAKLRVECAQWIAERRHGRAPASLEVDVSGRVEHQRTIRLDRLSPEDARTWLALRQRAGAVDGEVVPAKDLTSLQAGSESQNAADFIPEPPPTAPS